MDKKEIVIQAARELFTKYGYKKVTMDEIASYSGVTKKTIYTYFKDKDSMFQYFIKEELENARKTIDEKENKKSSPLDLLTSSLYGLLEFRKNSSLIQSLMQESETGNKEKCEYFIKMYDNEIISYIEEKINNALQTDSIRKCDPHLTAFIMYKVFISVIFEYDLELNEEEVIKEVTSILKQGLLK